MALTRWVLRMMAYKRLLLELRPRGDLVAGGRTPEQAITQTRRQPP
ncbi:hypothetical protein [Bradyrhizobium sp. 187]|nr:hypothetical protein [Bradyrhizobium sp. 187]UPJ71850.1 hypothetical protein IVB19_30255 [Bradyrhizobium sp. 187]